ncbi:ribonuclease III [Aureococcus anophagefferens]|nr:ribonuclease III [Aureococcus anophagefferens]
MLLIAARRFASKAASKAQLAVVRGAPRRAGGPPPAEDLESLSKRLDHAFDDLGHLEAALTHPSTGAHASTGRFERLEFLGDRVLGLVVAEWLHDHYPDEDEGESQIRHSGLVRTEALVAVAGGLRLDGHVRAKSHGLWVSRSNSNDTMVADALEAIVGAVFVDGGYAASKRVEHAQKHKRPLPTYETIRKTGPDHDPTITVQAHYGDRTANATAKGMHPSKRAASMAAAKILAELEAEARKGRRKKK